MNWYCPVVLIYYTNKNNFNQKKTMSFKKSLTMPCYSIAKTKKPALEIILFSTPTKTKSVISKKKKIAI